MATTPTPGVRSDLTICAGSKVVTGQEQVFIFGDNPDVSAGVPADVWSGGGDYVFPSDAGEAMELVSDSAGDVGMVILIQALDTDFNRVNIVQITNGIVAVPLGQNLTRINAVINIGSVEFSGALSVRAAGGGIKYSNALEEDQRSAQCIYTIPNGFVAFNKQVAASLMQSAGGSTICKVKFKIRFFGSVNQTAFQFGLQKQGTSLISSENQAPAMIPAKSDFIVRVESSDNSSEVSALLGLLLFAEDRIS